MFQPQRVRGEKVYITATHHPGSVPQAQGRNDPLGFHFAKDPPLERLIVQRPDFDSPDNERPTARVEEREPVHERDIARPLFEATATLVVRILEGRIELRGDRYLERI